MTGPVGAQEWTIKIVSVYRELIPFLRSDRELNM